MIVYIRNVKTIPGKKGEAKRWAIEMTEFINAQWPETKCKVFIPRFGAMNRIFWQTEFEDLAALDVWQKKLASDSGYRELSFQAQKFFDQDCMKDEVLVSLS